MRKPIIAGNWKMNKTDTETRAFMQNVQNRIPASDLVDSVVCPPFVSLKTAVLLQGKNLKVGAQNMHYLDHGAYTGEVAAEMLVAIGVSYVIIGHSERRKMFAETDACCNLKLKKAFSVGLHPILCVGENEELRIAGKTKTLLKFQLDEALKGISGEDVKKLTVAYEPIWAIGTGRTASPEIAEDACGYIRSVVRELYDDDVAEALRIQYGGSVNVKNIEQLLAMPDIDGALIGGASLKADDFVFMTSAALKKK